MKTIFLFSFLFTLNAYPIELIIKIRSVECKMGRGLRSEVKSFTLHDNYSLFVPFDSFDAFLLADHTGVAGARGSGFRYVLYAKDPKIGGYVQGASSSIIRVPLATQDITFEDPKLKIKVRCRGRSNQ